MTMSELAAVRTFCKDDQVRSQMFIPGLFPVVSLKWVAVVRKVLAVDVLAWNHALIQVKEKIAAIPSPICLPADVAQFCEEHGIGKAVERSAVVAMELLDFVAGPSFSLIADPETGEQHIVINGQAQETVEDIVEIEFEHSRRLSSEFGFAQLDMVCLDVMPANLVD